MLPGRFHPEPVHDIGPTRILLARRVGDFRRVSTSNRTPAAAVRSALIVISVFAMLALGCSAADLVLRQRVTPAPDQGVTLVPTYTPTIAPQQTLVIVTPPSEGRPGVIIVPPGMDPNIVLPLPPTADQIPVPATPGTPATSDTSAPTVAADATMTAVAGTPTATSTPSETPVPSATPTATPIPTATPYVMVGAGLVSVRTGPGIEYPQVAQLGPELPVAITGANADGSWLQICCISGEALWIPTRSVVVFNDISLLAQAPVEPPPPPTSTPTPSETPTPSPTPTATPYPFELAIGPQFFPTNNEHLTIWTKLFIGVPPSEEPASGYMLTVLFEGFQRPNSGEGGTSGDQFEFSAPPGSGSRVAYNYKYEYVPPDPLTMDPAGNLTQLQLLGTGTWTVYVSDGAGNQLSDPVTFTTAPDNPNREVYAGWARVR